eukprot:3211130-Amphidinium_carterae.1
MHLAARVSQHRCAGHNAVCKHVSLHIFAQLAWMHQLMHLEAMRLQSCKNMLQRHVVIASGARLQVHRCERTLTLMR